MNFQLGERDAGAWIVARTASSGDNVQVAFAAGDHEPVGVALVHRGVNDLLAAGAMPRGFTCHVLAGDVAFGAAEEVVAGVKRGCRATGIPLLASRVEAAPALRGEASYTAAGTIVGTTSRELALDGSRVAAGDSLIGIGSFGLHGAGVELARTLALDVLRLGLDDEIRAAGTTVRRAFLARHKSYLSFLAGCIEKRWLHALAPIVDDGIAAGVARALPEGFGAEIELGSWPVPPLFGALRRAGDLDEATMLSTFNLGLGMVAVVGPAEVDAFSAYLTAWNEPHWRIGRVAAGARGVSLRGSLAG